MFSSFRRPSHPSSSSYAPTPSHPSDADADQDSALDAAFSDDPSDSPDAHSLPSSPSPSQHYRPSSPTRSSSAENDDPLTRYAARYTPRPGPSGSSSRQSTLQPQSGTAAASAAAAYDFEGDPFAHRAGAVRTGESPPGYEGGEDEDGVGHGHGHGHGREVSAGTEGGRDGGQRTIRERLFPSFYARVAADDPDHPSTTSASTSSSSAARERSQGGSGGGGGNWFSGRTGGLFGLLGRSGRNGGGGGGAGNDGVFANLQASRPNGGSGTGMPGDWDSEDDNKDEPLPSYEAAAADSTPPYWETTVMAPVGYLGPDDILVDGLPVGNLFAFAWNLLVSMSFQFVGFLLTYLLHTSHAAKNGSRAGLGITLIQYGLYLRNAPRGLSSSPFLTGPDGNGTVADGGEGGAEADGDDGWFWPTGEQSPTDLGGGGGGGGEGEVPDLGMDGGLGGE